MWYAVWSEGFDVEANSRRKKSKLKVKNSTNLKKFQENTSKINNLSLLSKNSKLKDLEVMP